MKRLLFLVFVLILIPSLVMAHGNGLSDTYVHVGEGCTTAYYIDRDCDGYGVGTIGPNGTRLTMDADDKNVIINSLSSAEAIHGDMHSCVGTTTCADNLKTFLAARVDRAYTGKGNVYYVSPTGTAGGIVNRVDVPYDTLWRAKSAGAGSNDIIVVRGGSHAMSGYSDLYPFPPIGLQYAVGSELVIIGMPGETPVNTCTVASCNPVNFNGTCSGIIFDSLVFDNSVTPAFTKTGNCFSSSGVTLTNIIFRNMEVSHWLHGFFMMTHDTLDVLYENLVVFDFGDDQHGIYNQCGGSDPGYVCTNTIWRRTIAYENDYNTGPLLQFGSNANSNWSGFIFEKSIIHHSGNRGLSFQNSHVGTTVRNNVFFNNNGTDIQFFDYAGVVNPSGNKIINNSFYRGDTGNGILALDTLDPTSSWSVELTWPAGVAISDFTIRNNAWHITDSWGILFVTESGNIADWSIDHNVFYRSGGTTTIASIDGVTKDSTTFEAYASVSDNSYTIPNFTDVSTTYYNQDWKYNLVPTATSANLINMGSDTLAPTTDIKGTSRVSPFDIGAYEYSGGIPAGTTLLLTGTDTNKISIIFMPSGYTSAESASFQTKVTNNLTKLWANNFFADTTGYKQRFDVYRMDDQYDSDGVVKTESEIEAIINGDSTCSGRGFGDDTLVKCIHVVIDDDNSQDSPRTYTNYIRLRNDSDSYYSLAHEIGVHVLGNLSGYDSPLFGGAFTKDAYSCNTYTYSYLFTNIHDKNNTDKWSDLVGTVASCGGSFYCPSITTTDYNTVGQNFSNPAYKTSQIGMAKRTQDSKNYSPLGTDFVGTVQYGQDTTRPTTSITGIASNTLYTGSTTIVVTASDTSGIDRVEFYVSVDGGEYTSFGIDRTVPYSQSINLGSYPGKLYSIRIYTLDEAWNYKLDQYDGITYNKRTIFLP